MANSRYVFTFWLQPNVPDPSLYFKDLLGKAPTKPAGEPLETILKGYYARGQQGALPFVLLQMEYFKVHKLYALPPILFTVF